MPPRRKRKAAAPVESPPTTMEEASSKPSVVVVDDLVATYDSKNKRVSYTLKLSSKCSCGSHKLPTSAAYNSLSTSDDPAITMMEKTISTINRHKQKSVVDDDVRCDLDLSTFEFVMRSDRIWRGFWANIMEQVRQEEEAAKARSETQKKQHADKAATVAEKPWEDGVVFSAARNKHRALDTIMTTLEQVTGKSIVRMKELMPAVASRLNKAIEGLDCGILFDRSKQQEAMEAMFHRAKTCIKGLTSNNNNAQLLTGVAALFLPKWESLRMCCGALGLNRQAKYTEQGLANRKLHDEYESRKGEELKVGDMVTTRDGDGEVKAISIDSITISFPPLDRERGAIDIETTYKPASRARARLYEPRLDEYERKQRSDLTPKDWIDAIDAFHRAHNSTSPNKKDMATRRHHRHKRQSERAPRIYRY